MFLSKARMLVALACCLGALVMGCVPEEEECADCQDEAALSTNIIPHTQLSVVKATVNPTEAARAIDGDRNTRWLLDAGWPQELVLRLGGTYAVSGIRYYETWSHITRYEVYVSPDGSNWTSATSGAVSASGLTELSFPPQRGAFIKLRALGSSNGGGYAYISELDVLGTATGPVYYVAKNGSDQNSCASALSPSTPKLTIKSGLGCLKAGDKLSIRAGIYNESIRAVPSGTSWNAPVTIAAYAGESVTVRPTSGQALALTYVGSPIQYVVFDRLIFDGNKVYKFAVTLDGVNFSTNVHHIRFTNCEVMNATASGVLTGRGADFLEFIGCKIHHNGTDIRYDHGLYLESSDSLIENCDFYNNSAAGLHIYTGYAGDSNDRNIVRMNRAHNNRIGMIIGSGAGNASYNNLIYNNLEHGVEIGFGSTNTTFDNNTVYGNAYDGIQLRASSSATSVRNNIAYANGANINNYAGSQTTLSNNITTDPGLLNPAGGDFHLKLGSGAIDKGTTLPAIRYDYDGFPRPAGARYDVGAYEFH